MKIKLLVSVLILAGLFFTGCQSTGKKIVSLNEIQKYLLEDNHKKSYELERTDLNIVFWSGRLNSHPGNSFFSQQLAGNYDGRFKLRGELSDLLLADSLMKEANKDFKEKDVSILQSLAQLSISQHRFRDAIEYAVKAYQLSESRSTSALILADAMIETGDYSGAESLINRYSDTESPAYLIRASKMKEHKGEIKEAIELLKKANENSKSEENITMISFTDNMLGTYYLEESEPQYAYNCFIEALKYNPEYIPSLEGIAAIAMMYDDDPGIAENIYVSLAGVLHSPDPDLNLYKIARRSNNTEKKSEYLNTFLQKVSDPRYGRMYNKYLVNIEAEEFRDFDKARTIAESEINERPTPQSYFMLAWVYFQQGDSGRSIDLIKKEVEGKTSDPEILAKIDKIFLEETKKL